jgi:predicted secreted protein
VHNLVQLSASATVDVRQDLLTISMGTTREGAEAAAVQNQLRMALESALAEARKLALPGELDVRTGNFSLYPRYGRDGKMTGWQGTTELILEGRDFARISATAGKIQTLTLGNVSFGLSREQRAKNGSRRVRPTSPAGSALAPTACAKCRSVRMTRTSRPGPG